MTRESFIAAFPLAKIPDDCVNIEIGNLDTYSNATLCYLKFEDNRKDTTSYILLDGVKLNNAIILHCYPLGGAVLFTSEGKMYRNIQ